jgi:hypothetical protein
LKKLDEAVDQLFVSFTQELTSLEDTDRDMLAKAEAAIKVCHHYLEQLKVIVQQYGFTDQAEEIRFFKQTKPLFLTWCIYYTAIFNLYSHWPEGSETIQREHIKNEQRRIKQFFSEHQAFYVYYRTKSTHLDDKYFVRGHFDIRILPYSFYFDADTSFSTYYDYLIAQILAYSQLLAYLEKLLLKQECLFPISTSPAPSLTWTGSKAALVELIYGLHTSGMINNGQADVKSIARCFEQMLHIDLGNYYDIWQDIKMRKKERTRFFNDVMALLQKRMEEGD